MNFEPEDDRLDHSLRSKFEQFAPPPTGKVWPGIAPHIGPPPLPRRRRRPLPLPFLFGLTALLAGLAGWLLPHGAVVPATSAEMARVSASPKLKEANLSSGMANLSSGTTNPNPRTANPSSGTANLSPGMANPSPGMANPSPGMANPSPGMANLSSGMANPSSGVANLSPGTASPGFGMAILAAEEPRRTGRSRGARAESVATGAAALGEAGGASTVRPLAGPATSGATPLIAGDSTPVILRPLVALERQTLEQLPSTATLAAGPLDAESRTRFVGTLRRERAELLRLQRRTDSLLLALGDLPGQPTIASADTARQPEIPKPAPHRWSVLLTATPEQNTLNLQGPEDNPLTALRRNHETGRAGFSAAALAEYQLTPRLSVGAGLGYSTFGANLRITNKVTDVRVVYDSTTTRTTNVFTSINQTHSIRIVQVPQLSPIFNANGQVIRYDTVYVPRQDTVFSTIVQHDTVHTTRKVVTPLISKKETLTTRQLQPTYRFFTVPVLLRYRLSLGPGRWWADVAAGAQLQFFLGGTQVVTDDGETFRTQAITAGTGPFRALNVALSGSLALNYALTNRLSLSVAPSLRWQALSVYKPETGLIQQPTATGLQLGVRFKL
jgi:hypothetical protein